MKKLLCALLCVMMVFCMMPTMAFADGEPVAQEEAEVTTFTELQNALAAGGTIKLANDITTEAALVTSGVTATINLNGKKLTIAAGDNKFNDATNLTIENGTIDITGVIVSGNAVFCLDEYETTLVTTLSLNNVNLTGNGYSSAYGVFYIGKSSVLNISGGEWTLSNDTHASGGVFKADASSATLNISGTDMNFHNVRRVVTYADTTIEDAVIDVSGDADGVDAEMEHGFNRSPLTITNSEITMKDMVGRGITAENGSVEISGTSKVTITNAQEATIDVRGGQTVTIADTASVVLDKEPTITSGTMNSDSVKAPVMIGTQKFNTLKEALDSIDPAAAEVVIELNADAALNYGAREAYGTAETKSITINGNGHTLTMNQTNNDWSSFGMSNPEGKTIINDITINKTGYGATNGAWNKHTINWFCAVEMNDVTVNNSVAFRKDAQLNDVTVNESNGDFYAVWIYAEGQTVDVDGLTVISTGRGIKIDEEYVDDVKVVKLNLDNANFTTAKKSAIIVKSEAGAVITLGNNVDISGVAKDAFYAVWVDEDAAAHADKVIVNNGFKAIEGQVPAAPTFDAGVLKSNADDEYFICFEAHNLKNAKVKVELYSGTKLLVAKEHTNKFNGTVTGNFYTVRTTGTSWTETPDTWTAYDCVVPTHAVLYVDGTKARKCDVKFTSDEWIAFAGTAEHTYVNGVCPGCGAIEPVVPTPPSYGGGYVYIEKPEITADAGADYELSILGSTLKVAAKEGYEVVDVLLNGVSQGAVAELKGLETGDKVVIVTKAIGAEEPAEDEVQLVARSARGKVKGKNAIKLTWYAEDGSELNYDGYEIFRSTKRYSGFGKKPIFTTTRTTYWNTAVESGVKYFYKVRGFNVVDGEKVYSDWSLKAWRVAE